MTARLYISRHCVFCKLVEPLVRLAGAARGVNVLVFKLWPGGVAKQVNGILVDTVSHIPAVPALTIGNQTAIGFACLALIGQAIKEARHG